MPITLDASFRTLIAGELTNLCTLWDIERRDGVVFRFTDHDRDLTYAGNVYTCGIGYDRSAIEDKPDLSVDNMDVKGILDTSVINRNELRGGLFNSALVTITVIDHQNPGVPGIIRRRGWFGEVIQNDRQEFSVELRGLSQALSETVTKLYTPGCPVNLGSAKCSVPIKYSDAPLREDDYAYSLGNWIRVPEYPDFLFRCTSGGYSEGASTFDPAVYDVYLDETVVDGQALFEPVLPFETYFVVSEITSRKTFYLSMSSARLAEDATFYNGGTIVFSSGENNGIAREVYIVDADTSADGEVTLFLRMPFEIAVGDTGTLYPGCDKRVSTCKSRFGNVVNFRGFPHVPGDKYLMDYPDAK